MHLPDQGAAEALPLRRSLQRIGSAVGGEHHPFEL